jgi:sulfatase modifying factor 1
VALRVPLWLGMGLSCAVAGACSFTDLEYLGDERGQKSGSSGSSAVGEGGRAVDAGGASTASTSGAGDEPTAGDRSADAGASGLPLGQGGQPLGQGAQPTNEGGGTAAGAGAGGEPMTEPGVVYGVDGQSCAGTLPCPGGESCCRRFGVPEGSFLMGTNTDANAVADEKPPHSAKLAAFELDELEVTVGRFRRFVQVYDGTVPASGAGKHPKLADSGWQVGFGAELPTTRTALENQLNCDVGAYQTWTTQPGAREDFPINCVSWYVAFAFCVWDGGRLPTEAEWEKASAGGDAESLYPWGAAAPDYAVHAVANCQGDATAGCTPADLLPVGSRSAGHGRWGHQDLAGNLWEWTLDHYDATYYQSVGTCQDCANLAALTPRVIRGGNFTSLPKNLRATGRASKAPNVADPYAGFRCAHSL